MSKPISSYAVVEMVSNILRNASYVQNLRLLFDLEAPVCLK